MAPPLLLDDLPLEVLIAICEALNHAYRPSIAAFSLTSKRCCLATSGLRFRCVRLQGEGPTQLIDAVARWHTTLTASNAFAYVHDLQIKWNAPKRRLGVVLSSEERTLWQRAWAMLTILVERMPNLADLTYDNNDSALRYNEELPFPTCLLRVLHARSRSKKCRLHVLNFYLWSLVGKPYDDGTLGDLSLTPDEHLLATSPCLHSVRLERGRHSSHQDYNPLALQQLVQGGNPHLQSVEHCEQRLKGNVLLPCPPGSVVRQWNGFATANDRARPALQSLRLGEGSVCMQSIAGWHSRVNFTSLHTLGLLEVDVHVLRWVVETSDREGFCVFPQLTCLELEAGRYLEPEQPTRDIALATQELLRCLSPLEELTLSGLAFGDSLYHDMTQSTMAAVLAYHGHSLRRLSLPKNRRSPSILKTSDDARELVIRCPQLRHLNISLRRSGDAQEVGIYQQLGSNSQLQSISLTLDCTQDISRIQLVDLSDEAPWNNHPRLRNGHIRRALVNCALDGQLAAAIFRRFLECTAIKSLTLSLSNPGKILPISGVQSESSSTRDALHPVFEKLGGGRVWTVTPHPNDARAGELIVTSSGDECNPSTPLQEEKHIELGELEHAFRSLWPAKKESGGNWKDDWRSFPLP